MSENLFLPETESRVEKYEALIPQIEALISTESDLIANLANVAAALKEGMNFFWVGFYLVKEDELVLGPFQGPIACTRIKKGKGVCGTAWAKKRTVIVEDVDQFPGHIACSSASKSEIVLPAIKDDEVKLILDIDSDELADFNQEDQIHLERLMKIIEAKL
ncbi:MAG: GAF domain-containing protein [Reichenbachiella sp.]|uniref:GAF domain-containing protein n=1 Tax=Reichenbachiella sp. TaxID=2184521 RepID=UPI0029664BE9|nr:GAF domain-containing protein [Reichenbachiella sp.]MDW3208557.1 GAF domain-containing protein [Reichenbachiella sp.]